MLFAIHLSLVMTPFSYDKLEANNTQESIAMANSSQVLRSGGKFQDQSRTSTTHYVDDDVYWTNAATLPDNDNDPDDWLNITKYADEDYNDSNKAPWGRILPTSTSALRGATNSDSSSDTGVDQTRHILLCYRSMALLHWVEE